PGPLNRGPFYFVGQTAKRSLALTFLATASSYAGVFSADIRQAALPLSLSTPLPLSKTVLSPGRLPSDARNDSRKGEFDSQIQENKFKRYEEVTR
ncbi:hypothetical protein, partial [Bradyrhizobium genomosp. III]|uniref:hypothetical protein n=1 Tax=Bradyrhizobium genomosp. III TaxID=2683271 RepID=UPI001AEC50DC